MQITLFDTEVCAGRGDSLKCVKCTTAPRLKEARTSPFVSSQMAVCGIVIVPLIWDSVLVFIENSNSARSLNCCSVDIEAYIIISSEKYLKKIQ